MDHVRLRSSFFAQCVIVPHDLGYTETDMRGQDWRAPLESLRTTQETWEDARAPDELEEEEEGRPAEPYTEEGEETTRGRAQ